MIDIKDYNGTVLVSIEPTKDSVKHVELMSSDYIRLKFNLARPIIFRRGTYVRESFGWYKLREDYKPKYNKTSGGFSYDMQFDAWYMFWEDRMLTLNPRFGAQDTSFSLTDYLTGHVNVIQRCLRYNNLNIYYGNPSKTYRQYIADGGTDQGYTQMLAREGCSEINIRPISYSQTVDDGLPEDKAKGISYESCGIISALKKICSEENYDCEWWIEENYDEAQGIHDAELCFGTCQKDSTYTPMVWRLGQEVEDMQRGDSTEDYCTRLIAFGSTTNVPARYRKSLIFTVSNPSSDMIDEKRPMYARFFHKSTREYLEPETRTFPREEVGEYSTYLDSYGMTATSVEFYKSPKIEARKAQKVSVTYTMHIDIVTYHYDAVSPNINATQTISKTDVENAMKPVTCRVMYYGIDGSGNEVSLTEVGHSLELEEKTIEYPSGGGICRVTFKYKTETFLVPADTDHWRVIGENIPTQFLRNMYILSIQYNHNSGENEKEYPIKASCSFKHEIHDYRCITKAHVLTGAQSGATLDVIINPSYQNVNSVESAVVKILGFSMAAGDQYTLDNVIEGLVDVGYFTDDLATEVSNYERRLMLPIDKYPYNYIDSSECHDANGNVIESRVVEVVKVFDDIYPSRTFSVEGIYEWDTEETDPEDETGNSKKKTRHYIIFVSKDEDTGFPFDETYRSTDGTFSCQFQTGKLAGMNFEIYFWENKYDGNGHDDCFAYEVVTTDSYGNIVLPNPSLYPSVGDKVVFLNYDCSKLGELNLISEAEGRLEKEALKTLRKIEKDTSRYTCPLMSDYAKWLMEDRTDKGLPKLGELVTLYNYGYFDTFRASRVIGYEYKLDIPYDTPKFIIGEDEAYSRSGETNKQISALTSKVLLSGDGNGGGFSYSQIRDMIANYGTEYFLSKLTDDIASGRITFERGLESNGQVNINDTTDYGHSFVRGVSGAGIYKDEDGKWHAQFDVIKANYKLQAETIEVMHTQHVGGKVINSPAGAKIVYVEALDGSGRLTTNEDAVLFRCYFEAKDKDDNPVYNKFAIGDQALCEVFEVKGQHNVRSRFWWRLILSAGYSEVRQQNFIDVSNVRDITADDESVTHGYAEESEYPAEGDSVVVLGSRTTKERANAIIQSPVGDNTPYIVMYTDIVDFVLPNGKEDAVLYVSPDGFFVNAKAFQLTVKDRSGAEYKSIEDYINDTYNAFYRLKLSNDNVTVSVNPNTNVIEGEKPVCKVSVLNGNDEETSEWTITAEFSGCSGTFIDNTITVEKMTVKSACVIVNAKKQGIDINGDGITKDFELEETMSLSRVSNNILVRIETSTGNFNVGVKETNTLWARVYDGDTELTYLQGVAYAKCFSWYRTSKDKDGDEEFNNTHKAYGQRLTVGDADIWKKAQFTCEVEF